MELIKDFEIDPFLTLAWVNKKAKENWANIIPQIGTLINNLEVVSVIKNHRPVSWQTLSEEHYYQHQKAAWEAEGLKTMAIHRVGQFEGFAHKHAPVIEGQPCNVCVIVSRELENCYKYKKAFEEGDSFIQGQLLGYPDCCSQFFCDVWPQGYYDPIWQALERTDSQAIEYLDGTKRKAKVTGHPFSNSILRYVGVRAGFHIVCSFDCQKSIEIGKQRMQLSAEIDPELTELQRALMCMPHSWDCYHGIAVVRTPIFYVITSSVPCKEQHVIEVMGDFIPREAEHGTSFPFNLVEQLKPTAEEEAELEKERGGVSRTVDFQRVSKEMEIEND